MQVFYVDLGYTLILSYDAIKPLPRKYMSCKTQVIDDSYQFHIYNSTKTIFFKIKYYLPGYKSFIEKCKA